MSRLRDAALKYAQQGWRVLPCLPLGKEPMTRHGFHDATTDARIITQWWRQEPAANIGLDIPEGLVILDFDPRNYTEETLEGIKDIYLPATRKVKTPSGGEHLYFTVPSELAFRKHLLPGIDVKAGGRGYVLLPPSVIDGREYAWYPGASYDIADLPTAVIDRIARPEVMLTGGSVGTPRYFPWEMGSAYGMAVLHNKCQDMVAAKSGERNEVLNSATFTISQFIAGGELAEGSLQALRKAAEQAGLPAEEIYATMHSAWLAGMKVPRRAPRV